MNKRNFFSLFPAVAQVGLLESCRSQLNREVKIDCRLFSAPCYLVRQSSALGATVFISKNKKSVLIIVVCGCSAHDLFSRSALHSGSALHSSRFFYRALSLSCLSGELVCFLLVCTHIQRFFNHIRVSRLFPNFLISRWYPWRDTAEN